MDVINNIINNNHDPSKLYEFPELLYLQEKTLNFQKELSRFERLNTIGEMAAGIGHKVRNPMTVVRGYLQIFNTKKQFAEYNEQLTTLINELDRANHIISEFLSLAKDKQLSIEQGNINSILNTLFPLLQADAYRVGHDIHVEKGEMM